MIQPTLFLGLPAHLRLDQIEIASQTLILSLAVETAEAACPLCQHVSHRIHSHDTRMLADLPSGGKTLRLLVMVRRFFCENGACARRIFAERLASIDQCVCTTNNTLQRNPCRTWLCVRRKSCCGSGCLSRSEKLSHDHYENAAQNVCSSSANAQHARQR